MHEHRTADPRRLEVGAFARSQQTLRGRLGLDEMPRLRASVLPPADPAAAPVFEWQASGSLRQPVGRDAQIRLHLTATGEVLVSCQRCLEPMAVALAVDSRLRFVAGEDEAQRLDEHSDDEDVLALPVRLDLIELIEDELILALPLVPRHENCPAPLPVPLEPGQSAGPVQPESPFAGLARLRGTGTG